MEATVKRGTALRDMTNVVVVVETVNTEAIVMAETEREVEVEAEQGEVGATTDVVIVTSIVEVEEMVMMEDIPLDMMVTGVANIEAHARMTMPYLVQVVEEVLVRMAHHVAIDVDEEAKEEMEWEPQREDPQLLKVLYLCPSESARLQVGTSMHLVTSSTRLSRPNKLVRPFNSLTILAERSI